MLKNALIIYGWKVAFWYFRKQVLMMSYFISFNKYAKITIFTFFVNTGDIQTENIVKQGRCNGPVLCSLSNGDFCKEEFNSSQIFL